MADAWDPPQGGQWIMQATHGEEEGVPQSEAQLYWEGPAAGGGRVAKLWLRHVPDRAETQYEAMAARRWRIDAPADAAAVQGAVIARRAADQAEQIGLEIRGMAGWNLGAGVYAGAEAAAQLYDTGLEPRLEATLGHGRRRSLAYLQVRYGHDFGDRGLAQAEAAVVLFSASGWGVQLGARAGLDNDEQAFTIGLWRSPGRR